MLQWDYWLFRVKTLLGVGMLSTHDELCMREAWESDLSPEFAADQLKLYWLEGAADQQSESRNG